MGDGTHPQQMDHAHPPPGAHEGSPMQTDHLPLPQSTSAAGSPPYNFSLPQHAQGAGAGASSQQWNFQHASAGNRAGGTAGSPLQHSFIPLPPSSQSFGRDNYSPGPPDHTNYDDDDGLYDAGPLAHELNDLRMDDTDDLGDETVFNLDSPPRSKKSQGKKRQRPQSPTPSPPPLPAPPSRTSIHDGRGSFKSHANQLIIREKNKTPSVTSSSRTSSGRGNSKPSSPTSQTSFSERASSRDSVSKRLRTEVREQVDMLNDDLESMHSEKLTLYQLKNERLMVKMNANRQDKEHMFLREERAHERSDATLVHQRLQETKAQEIRLREADAKALELEREVMLLRIEYAKLNQK